MNELRNWKKDEWKAALKRLRMSPTAFAAAIPLSPSALNKVFKNDPDDQPHEHTWDRVEKAFHRLQSESKAAG